jgi:transposase
VGQVPFPTAAASLQRDVLLDELQQVDRSIHQMEKALDAMGRKHPGVMLLQTIPGVGSRTAEALVAWIDDARRFARNKAIGNYFGLIPCQDQSASKNRLGHITREGPAVVRALLTEAAWQAIRRSAHVREYFNRICRQDHDRRKIALIATAHYLARVVLAMLGSGQGWKYERKGRKPQAAETKAA